MKRFIAGTIMILLIGMGLCTLQWIAQCPISYETVSYDCVVTNVVEASHVNSRGDEVRDYVTEFRYDDTHVAHVFSAELYDDASDHIGDVVTVHYGITKLGSQPIKVDSTSRVEPSWLPGTYYCVNGVYSGQLGEYK